MNSVRNSFPILSVQSQLNSNHETQLLMSTPKTIMELEGFVLKSCVKKSQFLQFCSGMVKGPVVAVMDREAGSHIGVRDRFHTHATHERAPLGGPTPSAGGPFDFITSTNST